MSQPDRAHTSTVRFERANPVLSVRDLAASVDYYVHTLGFEFDWEDSGVASVSRGRAALFLCEGDQGHPGAWVWIGVSDAEALYEEYRTRGANVRHPPTNYAWALEMQVQDLDGNVLRLGSDPLPDRAAGPWLDMHGTTWVRRADGSWAHEEAE